MPWTCDSDLCLLDNFKPESWVSLHACIRVCCLSHGEEGKQGRCHSQSSISPVIPQTLKVSWVTWGPCWNAGPDDLCPLPLPSEARSEGLHGSPMSSASPRKPHLPLVFFSGWVLILLFKSVNCGPVASAPGSSDRLERNAETCHTPELLNQNLRFKVSEWLMRTLKFLFAVLHRLVWPGLLKFTTLFSFLGNRNPDALDWNWWYWQREKRGRKSLVCDIDTIPNYIKEQRKHNHTWPFTPETNGRAIEQTTNFPRQPVFLLYLRIIIIILITIFLDFVLGLSSNDIPRPNSASGQTPVLCLPSILVINVLGPEKTTSSLQIKNFFFFFFLAYGFGSKA